MIEEEQASDETSAAYVDWAKFSQMRSQLGANFVRILSYFREDGEKSVGRIEEAMHRRDCAALVLPAHTMKAEARQFGAEPLAALAEEIEQAARRGVEGRFFPDEVLPQVARLRPLYGETIRLLEQEINPLAVRRQGFGRKATNQEFGRI